jgi:hypothetical protein
VTNEAKDMNGRAPVAATLPLFAATLFLGVEMSGRPSDLERGRDERRAGGFEAAGAVGLGVDALGVDALSLLMEAERGREACVFVMTGFVIACRCGLSATLRGSAFTGA